MLPKPVEAVIARARAIVDSMTDNPHFPAPVPALWVVSGAMADLQKAEAAARTRATGTAAARDEKRTMLHSLLHQLRGYVQVSADADPQNAAPIIGSASMGMRKESHRAPRVFSAKPGTASGEVRLVAPRAGDRAAYEWEYSTDGGASWVTMPPTMQSSTRLVGLTPETSLIFKYRCVTRWGASGWSQPVPISGN